MRVYHKQHPSLTVASTPADLRKWIVQGNYVAVKRSITRNRYLVHCPSGWGGFYPIHVAVRAGHTRIVKLLLHYGADPNVKTGSKWTPTHLCVLNCRHRMVGLLFARGADSTMVDYYNRTPLELAALMNKRRCVDMMLNWKIPDNVLNKAFHQAVAQGNTIMMNKLLNRGADINYKEEMTGFTALLEAIMQNNMRVCQFLLEKGANPAVYNPDKFWTCLHYAVYFNYPSSMLSLILDKYTENYLNFPSKNEETALHLAARKGNKIAAIALVQAGANVDALDCKNYTPLLTALNYHKDGVSRIIVYGGADVNIAVDDESPLIIAVARESLSLVRLFLEHGAFVVKPGEKDLNWTSIHTMCTTGNTDILSLLLEYIQPDALTAMHMKNWPMPPLLVAASRGHGSSVELLLDHGVDVNLRGQMGETALHMAVRSNSSSLVSRLLNRGACVDASDAKCNTRQPLDVAVYTLGRRMAITATLIHSIRLTKAVVRNDVDAVKFLLACDVSPNVTTQAYGTPLHVAVRYKQYHMIRVLLSSSQCLTSTRHNGVTALEYAIAMGDARAVRMIEWRDTELWRRRTRHLSLANIAKRTAKKPRYSNAANTARRNSI